MGVALVGFAEASLLTTWTTITPGARHGLPEATLLSQTTLGLTPPFLAALPFTVAGQGPSGPAPPLYLPPTPWAPSEAGQEPPRPFGRGSHLLPLPLLRHPPPLQSPRLRWAPLSSGAGKINSAASLNTPKQLPLTFHWYTGVHSVSPGGVIEL